MKAYHWRNLIAERDRLKRLSMGEPAPDAPDVQVNLPPRNVPPAQLVTAPAPPAVATPHRAIVALPDTTPGRYICIECRFYAQRQCTNSETRSPVTGNYVEAMAARKERESCGSRGRYFQARMRKPVRARVVDDSEPEQYIPPVPVRRLEVFRDEQIVSLWDVAMRPDCA